MPGTAAFGLFLTVVVRLMVYMFSPLQWALLQSAAALAPRCLRVADVQHQSDHNTFASLPKTKAIDTNANASPLLR